MSTLLRTRHKRCACSHGCGASAVIKEWNCGCVEVIILNNQRPGPDCTDFSGMRIHCRRCVSPGPSQA